MASDEALFTVARAVGEHLLARRWRLATAESCTAGWIAKAITDVAGSSSWFDSGYVTYSNAAKTRDLGVPAEVLAAHGAVSEAVVRAMAEGALRRTGADLAVATSGIAGPDGGVPGKPVGTVWFALALRRGDVTQTLARLQHFPGDRASVRRASVRHALEWILEAGASDTP
ncbi:MAG: CinA family protein [Steroidobacteraceae bacterium]